MTERKVQRLLQPEITPQRLKDADVIFQAPSQPQLDNPTSISPSDEAVEEALRRGNERNKISQAFRRQRRRPLPELSKRITTTI